MVFVAAHRLSLVAASGGYSSLRCMGFSLLWLLLFGAQALGTQALVVEARELSSCGSRGMWALPGPGLKPVSPALAGGFFFCLFVWQGDS